MDRFLFLYSVCVISCFLGNVLGSFLSRNLIDKITLKRKFAATTLLCSVWPILLVFMLLDVLENCTLLLKDITYNIKHRKNHEQN